MTARAFSTTYKSELAASYVWVPLILGAILGMVGLFLNMLIFTLSSAIFTCIALRHWPYIDALKPVLKLESNGATIDGIGHLSWSAIEHVELIEKRRKNQSPSELCTLKIVLNAPLPDLANKTHATTRARWHKPIAQQFDDQTLYIQPGILDDDQVDIANAFAWFLKPHTKK